MDILKKIKNNKIGSFSPYEIEEYLNNVTDLYNDPILIELASSKEKYEFLLMPILKRDYNTILGKIKNNFNPEKYFKKHINMLNENNMIYAHQLKKKIETILAYTMPIECKWYINYLKYKYENSFAKKIDLSFFPSLSHFNHKFEWSQGLSVQEKNHRIGIIKNSRGSILTSKGKHYIYINLQEYYKEILNSGLNDANFDLINTFFHELTHAKQLNPSFSNKLHSYKIDKSYFALNACKNDNNYKENYDYFYHYAYHEYDARINAAALAKNEIEKYNFTGKEDLLKKADDIILYNSLFTLNKANSEFEDLFDSIAHKNDHYGYPFDYSFEYDENWKRMSLSDFMNKNYNLIKEDLGNYIAQRIIETNDEVALSEQMALISNQHQSIVLKIIKERLNEIGTHKELTNRALKIEDINTNMQLIGLEKLQYLDSLEGSLINKFNTLKKEYNHELHRRK